VLYPSFPLSSPFLFSDRRRPGFTLVELCIVLVIVGGILAVAAAIAIPILRTAAMIQTDAKLANIAKAIDFYATQNYRVPCPAVPDTATANPPFGYEAGSGVNGNVVPTDCGAVATGWEGIVPFKTLNIPADWVRDAWGHYITYAISPNFAQDVTNAAIPVHARCRTSDWFAAGIIYEQGAVNPYATPPTPGLVVADPSNPGNPASNVLLPKNEKKARFCCSGVMPTASDLVIDDINSQSQIAVTRQSVTDPNPLPGGTGYAAANVTFPNPMASNVQVPDADRTTAPVYILVSHGRDGYGAYTGQGAGLRVPIAGATPDEIENANGDRIFYEIPAIDRAGVEMKFDDVVVWRTQDMMFATQGKSCSLP